MVESVETGSGHTVVVVAHLCQRMRIVSLARISLKLTSCSSKIHNKKVIGKNILNIESLYMTLEETEKLTATRSSSVQLESGHKKTGGQP